MFGFVDLVCDFDGVFDDVDVVFVVVCGEWDVCFVFENDFGIEYVVVYFYW